MARYAQGKRPAQSPKLDLPWLKIDEEIIAIFRELPEPWNIMFLISVTAGLRNGEIAGLRLSDCNFEEKHLRVRFSLDYPRCVSGGEGPAYSYRSPHRA